MVILVFQWCCAPLIHLRTVESKVPGERTSTLIFRGVNFDLGTMVSECQMEAEYLNNDNPCVSVVFFSSNTPANGESKVIVERTSTLIFGGVNFYLITMVCQFEMAAKNKNDGGGDVSEFRLGACRSFRCKKLTFCFLEVRNSIFFSVIEVKSSVMLDSCSRIRK